MTPFLDSSSDDTARCEAAALPHGMFVCPARIGFISVTRLIYIRSPRTGNELGIVEGYWPDLPASLVGKALAAAERGEMTAEFTRDELAAFAALRKRIDGS